MERSVYVRRLCRLEPLSPYPTEGDPMSKLSRGQQTVLRALKDFGRADDTALAVYVHHVADADMSSSGVRSRRAELAWKGFVTVVGVKRTKSGRSAAIHAITKKGEAALARAERTAKAVA